MAKTRAASLGGGVVLLAAVGVTAFSMTFNYAFGMRIGGDDPTFRTIFAAGLVVTDIFKVALPVLAITAWRARYRLLAIALWVVFAGSMVLSATAAFSVYSINRVEARSAVTANIERRAAAQRQRNQKQSELDRLDEDRPASMLAALVKARETNVLWSRSAGCTDATRTDSRRFCDAYNKLVAELAGATRADALRRQVDALDRQIAAMTTAETVAGSDPDLALVHQVFAVDPHLAAIGRAILLALIIELAAAVGMSAVVMARPRAPGESPEGPLTSGTETPVGEAPQGRAGDVIPPEKTRHVASPNIVPATRKKVTKTPMRGTSGRRPQTGRSGSPRTKGTPALKLVPNPTDDGAGGEDGGAIIDFVKSYLVPIKGRRVPASAIYGAYADYCSDRGIAPVHQQAFGKRLTALGYRRRKTGGGRQHYRDVMLCT